MNVLKHLIPPSEILSTEEMGVIENEYLGGNINRKYVEARWYRREHGQTLA